MSAPQISLIVAMNYQRVIGINNQLPWHIPEDLAYFKQLTLGKPIIMGRKTFESIGRVLPGRSNIVISRSGFSYSGVEVYTSLATAIAMHTTDNELWVIGGGEIFQQALPLATQLYITWVDYPIATSGIYFPELDLNSWLLVNQHDLLSTSGIKCSFNQYTRLITHDIKS